MIMQWNFTRLAKKKFIVWVEMTEALPKDVTWRGKRPQGRTKQGNRAGNSKVVRFHLLSASQEHTQTKKGKMKNTCMAERPGD